jgi:hypothetical protein
MRPSTCGLQRHFALAFLLFGFEDKQSNASSTRRPD